MMTRHRLSLPVSIVKQYTLEVIQRKMPPIQLQIAGQHTTPFPKDRSRLKSFYEYRARSLSRDRRGQLRGGAVRLVATLFDFTFVRSILASAYSTQGGHCYDPASLFVLLVFAFVDGYEHLCDFVDDLHHVCRGHQYRVLAGLSDEHIPQEADFSNFIRRCGSLFDVIFHAVVEIMQQASFISGCALTTDGMLIPTWSRYRGCNYFAPSICSLLAAPENLESLVQTHVDELAARLSAQAPVQGGYVQIECPRWQSLVAAHPHLRKKKPKKLLLFHLRLSYSLPGWPCPDDLDGREALRGLGLEIELAKHIGLKVLCCHVVRQQGELCLSCPRVPTDTEGRLGLHLNPRSGEKEYIFGRNVVTTSNVEVRLGGLTLPVALSVYPANINEGAVFIEHDEQIEPHHFPAQVHVLDGAYDSEPNYAHLRAKNCWPIIDYNSRREDLRPKTLQTRGYNEQGWPYADCECLMPPLGALAPAGAAVHACYRQCLRTGSGESPLTCPHLSHPLGQVKRMAIADHPRLVAEIVRGTPEREKVAGLRSPSESINSYAQHCTGLKAPRVRGDPAFFARSHLSLLGLLLRKMVDFIADMTNLLQRIPAGQERLLPPPPQTLRQQRLKRWLMRLLYDET
jgi:hypothetical protein